MGLRGLVDLTSRRMSPADPVEFKHVNKKKMI